MYFYKKHPCKKIDIASISLTMTDIVIARNIVAKQSNF